MYVIKDSVADPFLYIYIYIFFKIRSGSETLIKGQLFIFTDTQRLVFGLPSLL